MYILLRTAEGKNQRFRPKTKPLFSKAGVNVISPKVLYLGYKGNDNKDRGNLQKKVPIDEVMTTNPF